MDNTKTFTVQIESLVYQGSGLSHIDGKALFVPYTAPGDVVEVKITKDKKNYLEGRIVQVLKQSPLRTTPLCPLFEDCGGCQYQHISYASQLEWKKTILGELLTRFGALASDEIGKIQPMIPSDQPYHYRNGARFRLNSAGSLGFLKQESNRIIPVPSCPVLTNDINEKLPDIEKQLSLYGIKPEAFDFSHDDHGSVTTSPVYNGQSELGFRQKNDSINRILQKMVVQFSDEYDLKKAGLLDLFCGDGNLSMDLLFDYSYAKGYDLSGPAVKSGNKKARSRGLDFDPYLQGDLKSVINRITPEKERFSMMIVDPPRSGLKGIAKTTAQWNIPLVLYISCVPSHLARDLKVFKDQGYFVESVNPVDMFPQTYHIESLTILRRKN